MTKPANQAERDALAAWQKALPSTAMTILAQHGYGEMHRYAFLTAVAGVSESDAVDFRSPSYVSDSA